MPPSVNLGRLTNERGGDNPHPPRFLNGYQNCPK